MLKGIDPVLGPDLLHTLAAMGHGDELVVVDRNYPATSHGRLVHRLDGVATGPAMTAVLSVLPLDSFIEHPVECMEVVGSGGALNEVQLEVQGIARAASHADLRVRPVERLAFYERTKDAYAILITGEERPFGCFILTKGVLPDFTP